jgi:broad-specificity NMP kinase
MEGDIKNLDIIPKGIYEVDLDLSGWSLQRTGDAFVFPYKLYNLQRDFLDHVKKTYFSTKGNLGILFNGTRGTGKTVSAKIFANELELPIIIVKSMGDSNPGLISYLSSFNFDCIFFFDEFEKQFHDGDSTILQFMDGVFTSDYRRVFLLTTNELSVNQNLLSRPSRIRYVREFGNLQKNVVDEYLEDNLIDKSGKSDLMDYIDTLTISTIDILKSIVEEVNIHGIEQFLNIKKSFNVSSAVYQYTSDYMFISRLKVESTNYNISKFLEELENYKKRYEIQEAYDIALSKTTCDEEEQLIRDKFGPLLHYTGSFNYRYAIQCDKPWNKLIPGKDCFYGDMVIKVDIERQVIVTKEGDGDLYFYKISNPGAKPSLYGSDFNEREYFAL